MYKTQPFIIKDRTSIVVQLRSLESVVWPSKKVQLKEHNVRSIIKNRSEISRPCPVHANLGESGWDESVRHQSATEESQ